MKPTPYEMMNARASAYITSLWGERRRAFAADYWRHLTRQKHVGVPPTIGAKRIVRKLTEIYHDYSWSDFQ